MTVDYRGISHRAELDTLELVAAAAPIYHQIVSNLRALFRAEEVPALPSFALQKAISTTIRDHERDYWTGTVYSTNRRVWEHDPDFKEYLRSEEEATGYKLTLTGIFAIADGIYRTMVMGLAGSLGFAVMISLLVFMYLNCSSHKLISKYPSIWFFGFTVFKRIIMYPPRPKFKK